MASPVLLIMAAGMGSRYGGLKQMDPIGPNGELILDYSLFDAKQAGFERAIIIIKRENEADFHEVLGQRISKHMNISYAYQELTDLPNGFKAPTNRVKPFGTGHAVLSARSLVDAPFCVINADDFYGREAFKLCFEHLNKVEKANDYMMVGYRLKNTLSETGFVARGVCSVDSENKLTDLVERTHIISTVDGPLMSDDLIHYTRLDPDSVVSMNMWGFPLQTMKRIEDNFQDFLLHDLVNNPLKAEYFLPSVVNKEINDGNAIVSVLTTGEKWHGVTYREDKENVCREIARMTETKIYPSPLWSE